METAIAENWGNPMYTTTSTHTETCVDCDTPICPGTLYQTDGIECIMCISCVDRFIESEIAAAQDTPTRPQPQTQRRNKPMPNKHKNALYCNCGAQQNQISTRGELVICGNCKDVWMRPYTGNDPDGYGTYYSYEHVEVGDPIYGTLSCRHCGRAGDTTYILHHQIICLDEEASLEYDRELYIKALKQEVCR